MLRQPWFNFGLTIGDDIASTVTMPEAFYHYLDEAFWVRFRQPHRHNSLTREQQQRAWEMLGHNGEAPTICLAIRRWALEEAAEKARKQPP